MTGAVEIIGTPASNTPAADDSIPTDASAAESLAQWRDILTRIGAEEGSFESLGASHVALFVEDGNTLLVSFETMQSARERPGQMPLAHDIAAARGWSHLCLMADGQTWFRDPAVYEFFDAKVDDDFFEGYERVLFYGAGMGGYAACAFSVTAPGAQVLALNPRATLDPAQAGWDKRDRARRSLDFTSRYGYAPDMLEGAAHAIVIHDPTIPEEAMHASLFRAPYITRLSARHMGERIEWALQNMGVLQEVIEATLSRRLTPQGFARIWRKRRDFGPYLRALLAKAESSNRSGLEMMICRSVTRRLKAPRFARRLATLTAEKGAQ